MADLTASDVGVVLEPRLKDMARGAMAKALTVAEITLGDGAKTYPIGGVPLPAAGVLALIRNPQLVLFQQPADRGLALRYDAANHKLRIMRFKDPSYTARADSTSYSLGDLRVPATANGYLYRCSTAGTSHSSAPTFGTVLGGPTEDGTAVWTCVGLVDELVGGVDAPAELTFKALMIGD